MWGWGAGGHSKRNSFSLGVVLIPLNREPFWKLLLKQESFSPSRCGSVDSVGLWAEGSRVPLWSRARILAALGSGQGNAGGCQSMCLSYIGVSLCLPSSFPLSLKINGENILS